MTQKHYFNPDLLNDPDLKYVLSFLPEALFVGGMVRNFLLHQPITDIDMTSPLPPEEILNRFDKTEIKAVPTGIEHGTITLIYKTLTIEHTTFRKDIKTDGRRATVTFTEKIKEDAMRRDFTINALYATQEGYMIDPTGEGLLDIAAKKVRFIGKAEKRIEEDALRILRFFRFSLYYHGSVDFDEIGLAACAALAPKIKTLSKERITEEIFKILNHPKYIKAIRLMQKIGLLNFMISKPNLIHLDATKYLETSPQKHLIRLAALCESYQMIEFAFPLFRFSKKEAQYLHFLISPPQIISTEHALYYHGYEKTLGLMLIEKLSFNEEKLANWTIKTFPLKGEDLIHLGYSPDRILGKVLKETETWWIEHHFTPSKADCLNYVRSHFQQM